MRTLLAIFLLLAAPLAAAKRPKPPKIRYGISRERQTRQAEKARNENQKRQASLRRKPVEIRTKHTNTAPIREEEIKR